MDQSDHRTSVIAFTMCKVIRKIITKIDFWYQTDLLDSFVHACLVPKIDLSCPVDPWP